MWVLILTLMTGTVGENRGAAMTSITGFQSEEKCEAAGAKWEKQMQNRDRTGFVTCILMNEE